MRWFRHRISGEVVAFDDDSDYVPPWLDSSEGQNHVPHAAHEEITDDVGGNSGSSSAPLYGRASIRGGSDSGADIAQPVSGTFFNNSPTNQALDWMAFTGPSTMPAARISSQWLSPPYDLPAGASLVLSYVEFMWSNAAGTEKLRFEYDGDPITLTPDPGNAPRFWVPFADCSITEQIGSDLDLVSFDNIGISPGAGIAGIQTTAGGQFFQELFASLNYTTT